MRGHDQLLRQLHWPHDQSICLGCIGICRCPMFCRHHKYVSLGSVHPPRTHSSSAQWYTPKEQPTRQVLWFLGTPIFGIFGGLLGYALGNTHTEVASWRLLYIVFGSVTALWGILFAYTFPESPEKAKFLSEEDRVILISSVSSADSTNSPRLIHHSLIRSDTPISQNGSCPR